MDWKEALGQAFDMDKVKAEVEAEKVIEDTEIEEESIQKEPLRIVIDRKARKGKTAIIIEGFVCDDEKLKEIAKALKVKIGTGGSSRAGEILLQGDMKEKTTQILKEMGYKVKG